MELFFVYVHVHFVFFFSAVAAVAFDDPGLLRVFVEVSSDAASVDGAGFLLVLVESGGPTIPEKVIKKSGSGRKIINMACLLYTSPSPRDRQKSRMPSSA